MIFIVNNLMDSLITSGAIICSLHAVIFFPLSCCTDLISCRNMLHGPWKEAGEPTVVLNIDDANVDPDAIAVGLAYLYGHYPKLDDSNAFRVLAVASFLDLQVLWSIILWVWISLVFSLFFFPLRFMWLYFQDLCAICTDFIISELSTSNFLAYQVSSEPYCIWVSFF